MGCGWGFRCRDLEDFELCGSGHCVPAKEEDLPGVWPEVAMSQTGQPRSPVGTMSACIVFVVVVVVYNEDPLPLEAEIMVAASVTSTVSLPMSLWLGCVPSHSVICLDPSRHLNVWPTLWGRHCLSYSLSPGLQRGPQTFVSPTPQVT